MKDHLFPASTPQLATRRKELAPETHDAFQAFSRAGSRSWDTRKVEGDRTSPC